MTPTLKLPLVFDIRPLQAEVQTFANEEWTPHFNTQYYDGDWSGIALRAAENAHVELYPDPTASKYVDSDSMARCPSVNEILKTFECETESVRFLRLGVGASIREHRDYRLSIEDGVARIHIPVKTSCEVEFYLDGKRVEMNEGEAWYLNFNLPHSVENKSTNERIHLVIDCVANDWLRAFFD
ncbi:MAG: aspartyl beta-hydroxylase [Acidobacteria bacterium]|nr:MAG: aspartyl beta-hydroxylase [Acidobacteriota bacterium]